MKKVLIITYYWPPSGGAGVQRWLKFAKFLPEFGWEPVILTVDPAYATYPAIDPSLENELPPGIEVHRTRATDWFRIYSADKSKVPSAGFAANPEKNWKGKISRFIRGNFFIPDPRKGWNRFAFEKACDLIDKNKIVTIVTTSPPHSTQLIGLKLKKRYPGIKWIADLRDPWTDIYFYDQFYHSPLARTIDRNYEKSVLSSSDRIISVGRSMKEIFSSKVQGIENKISVIPNGYDEVDFDDIRVVNPDDFTISYIGTLSDSYPFFGFLEAIENFISGNLKIRLKFIGNISPSQKMLIQTKTSGLSVDFIPYVDHKTAIRYMMESSVLLLIIPDNANNKGIITGKIFEYLASGKPVICIGPEGGDAAEIIEKTSAGMVFSYNDSAKIKNYISKLISYQYSPDRKLISEYSRKHLTQCLADLLKE